MPSASTTFSGSLAAAPDLPAEAHVLVIDGDEDVLERTRDVLEGEGYRVSVADLPDIGLVRRVAPDAIVLGLLFRGRPMGLEFLELHAADPTTARVPVLVRAAAADVDDIQWRRLVTLARLVVPPEAETAELLGQLRTSLRLAAA
jgi:CheY-like chemotaxis protein